MDPKRPVAKDHRADQHRPAGRPRIRPRLTPETDLAQGRGDGRHIVMRGGDGQVHDALARQPGDGRAADVLDDEIGATGRDERADRGGYLDGPGIPGQHIGGRSDVRSDGRQAHLPSVDCGPMPHAPVQRLEAIVGAPIVEDARAPWGFENDTHLVTTADGRRLAVQRLHDRARARTRLQVVTIEDRLRAAGIPVPVFVAGHAGQPADDETATEPHFVTIQVDGSPGNTLFDDPTDAHVLATAMGRLHRSLVAVDIDLATDAELDDTWVDAGALARATRGWMADAASWLDDATRLAVERLADQLPEVLTGEAGVLAHGDFVPVNVLVRDRTIVALLDWEDARIADPIFDVAWWLWVVHHHHPDVHRRIAGTFRDAAGVASDKPTATRMELLVTLRHLEILARSRRADPERARRRAANLRGALDASAAAAFGP